MPPTIGELFDPADKSILQEQKVQFGVCKIYNIWGMNNEGYFCI